MLERGMNNKLTAPPPSFQNDVKPIPPMAVNVLQELGVPHEILYDYGVRCTSSFEHCCHSNYVGVADMTGSIPRGKIFVSGLGVYDDSEVECDQPVFVSGIPATEPADGKVLNSISARPSVMNIEDWKLLKNLPCGFVVFGPPRNEGEISIPESLAGGDPDGDLYVVLWKDSILDSIKAPGPLSWKTRWTRRRIRLASAGKEIESRVISSTII
jgi:hypothetical protein